MTPEEQEAEMRKAMGPGAHVAQHTAAEEKRAMQATNEATAVMAKQNELNAIMKRILDADAEFSKKQQAIAATPGGHDLIRRESQVKIDKIPLVEMGEAGAMPDPVKFKTVKREQATLHRNRALWELQQRTSLYTQRKADYKELAASYAAWMKQNVGPASGSAAKLMQEGTAEAALRCEEELIGFAENLAKFSQAATLDAAQYELQYQKTMSER
jgi:hypothetical protein